MNTVIAVIIIILVTAAALAGARSINGPSYGARQACTDLAITCLVIIAAAVIGTAIFGS